MATSLDADEETVQSSRNELGDFLRSRREKLAPESVGVKTGRRRRTPGLRREEVAELAGIGIDWYTRLEQGRTVKPSKTTLTALAKALRLSQVEAAHMQALAQKRSRSTFVRETVPEPLIRMIKGLSYPAYITGRRWDLLAWNDAAVDLFTDFGTIPEERRNLLLEVLTSPAMKELFGAAWQREARRMVAVFRTTYDLWAGDPAFGELLERMTVECARFADWWGAHDVRGASGNVKSFHHPSKGQLTFETATFQANDDPALKLAIYTPLKVRETFSRR